MSRRRSKCVARGDCDPSSAAMRRFDRLLTKIPEHTWWEDTTWYLGDNHNWTNAQLQAAIGQPNYQLTVSSWIEQRSYLPNAIRSLATSGESKYVALASELEAALDELRPSKPTGAALSAAGFVRAANASQIIFACGDVRVGFGTDGCAAGRSRADAPDASTQNAVRAIRVLLTGL